MLGPYWRLCIPEAIDEYDAYIGQQLDFGLDPDPAGDALAAEKTLEWFTRSMARLREFEGHG